MFVEVCLICTGLYTASKISKKFRPNEASKEKHLQESWQNVVKKTDKQITLSEKKSEQKINRDIAISSVSLGLVIAGYFYPVMALLSIPGIIYGGVPHFRRAWQALKQKKANVDTIVSITIGGCFVFGYLFIANVAIFVHALSAKLLSEVTQDSRENLIEMFKQTPDFVWIFIEGVEVKVPFKDVKAGDIAVVSTGEVVPADGIITHGTASIDQHTLTGEFAPAEKETGSLVFASTVVLSGRIYIKVEKAGEDTVVAKIGHILNNTVDFKSDVEMKAKIFSNRAITPTLICSAIALPILGPMSALAVVNSHYKEKLSVIIPISTMNFFKIASRNGILIKDGRSFELLDQVDTIVFDKTGTLTEKQPVVGAIHTFAEYDENYILTYAAASEYKQTHPVAKAIIQEAEKRKLTLPVTDEIKYRIGYGLTAILQNNVLFHVGSLRFIKKMNIHVSTEIRQTQHFCHTQGHSLVMVAKDNQLIGAIELIPNVRAEMKQLIRKLRKTGKIKTMYIISGDHETPTRKLARELEIEHYFAETLPEEKADIIEQLKDEGRFVCYVGDGINDAIALKKSHVSVSLSGASTVATDTAQIILMNGNLDYFDLLFDISRKYNKNINVSYRIALGQTAISISGVLFLGFGLNYTIGLNLVALLAGTVNSMLPILKIKENKA